MNNFDLKSYREFLFSKYARQYARLQYSYVVKYGFMLEQPNEIDKLPTSIKSNVLKSLVNLAKFLGQYESFKSKLKNYGIKWSSSDKRARLLPQWRIAYSLNPLFFRTIFIQHYFKQNPKALSEKILSFLPKLEDALIC